MEQARYLEQIFPFWNNLSTDEMDIIKKNITRKNFLKGEIISGDGNSCVGMVLIKKGDRSN